MGNPALIGDQTGSNCLRKLQSAGSSSLLTAEEGAIPSTLPEGASRIPVRMRSRLPLKEAHSRRVSPFPREGFVSSRDGWFRLGCKIPNLPYLRREAEFLMKRTLTIVSAVQEKGKLLYVKSFRGKRLNLYATH